MLFGCDPTYDHLRVFGSLCYAHTHGRLGDKFDFEVEDVFLLDIHMGKRDSV